MAAGGSTTVGKIQYIVDVDTKGLDKGLSSAERKFDLSSSKIGKTAAVVGKAMVAATAAASAATVALTTAAVKGYADYEQLTGGVETLFKSSSNLVVGYAKNAYKTANISANQYMEQATSFSATLLQGLKGDTEAAAKYADMAITDMADNANKMGTALSSIQDAYQGFAKNNYTMLDNLKLGYGGTAGEMARLINDSGVLGDSMKATAENVKDIPFHQVVQAIHTIQERLDITGTTAQEAADTVSGSFYTMKAAWDNLVVSLVEGNDFNGELDKFIETAGTFAQNVIPIIRIALGGIIALVAELGPMIVEQFPALFEQIVPPLLASIVTLAMMIVQMLPSLIQTIFSALVAVLPQLLQAIVMLVPLLIASLSQLVMTIVTELSKPATLTTLLNASVQLFLAILEAFPIMLEALIAALPQIIVNLISFLSNPNTVAQLLSVAVALFMAIVRAFPMILGALVATATRTLGELWNRIVNLFSNGGQKIGQAISGAVKGALNNVFGVVEGTINFFVDAINGVIGVINNIPGVSIGRLSRVAIPRMYTGGIVEPGGRIIHAGDGGEDEWVVPESKMASMIDKLGGAAGGQNIVINVSGTFATSAAEQRKVAQQIADQLQIINRSRMGVGGVI